MEQQSQTKSDLGVLRAALESGTMQQVERMVSVLHPAEVALLLESLPPPERIIVWGLVRPEDEGEVLVELNDEVRARLIEGMPLDELVIATEGLELDDLADVIADLPEAITQQIIRSLNQQDRER